MLSGNKTQFETTSVTDEDQTPGEDKMQKIKSCRLWKKGECEYKDEHMRSECPRNEYSRNKSNKYNEKRETIKCTLEEFEEDLGYNDEDLDTGDLINSLRRLP